MTRKLIMFLFPILLFGNYTGNIGTPFIQGTVSLNPFCSISEGWVYDIVKHKNLYNYSNSKKENIQDFDICSNFNLFSISMMRRFEIYTLIGSSYDSLKWIDDLLGGKRSKESEYNKHLSYAIGTKIILLQFAQTLLGINLQYFSFPCVHYVKSIVENLHIPFLENMQLQVGDDCVQYGEWSASIGIATHVRLLMPYVSISYFSSCLEVMKDHTTLTKYDNAEKWGVIIGCSANVNFMHFNIEIRRYNEMSIGAQMSTSF